MRRPVWLGILVLFHVCFILGYDTSSQKKAHTFTCSAATWVYRFKTRTDKHLCALDL